MCSTMLSSFCVLKNILTRIVSAFLQMTVLVSNNSVKVRDKHMENPKGL